MEQKNEQRMKEIEEGLKKYNDQQQRNERMIKENISMMAIRPKQNKLCSNMIKASAEFDGIIGQKKIQRYLLN
ncbi:MAG: hypothetical protein IJ853_00280 [Rickettsiales bacterium]|nr:hypothetical protein [Rickettsiales bacterium]